MNVNESFFSSRFESDSVFAAWGVLTGIRLKRIHDCKSTCASAHLGADFRICAKKRDMVNYGMKVVNQSSKVHKITFTFTFMVFGKSIKSIKSSV